MRIRILATALAFVAIPLAAGCASGTPAPTDSSSTAAVDDATTSACADAQTYNATAFAAVSAKLIELQGAIAAQDQATVTALATEGQRLQDAWSAKIDELVARNPKPEVVTALKKLQKAVTGETEATAAEMQAEFDQLSTALATACG